MPGVAVSSATPLVKPTTPCLDAKYADLSTEATNPCTDAMFDDATPVPREHLRQHRTSVKNTAVRLIAITASQRSSGNSCTGATCWMPALLTSTSTRPNSRTACSISPVTSAGLDRSAPLKARVRRGPLHLTAQLVNRRGLTEPLIMISAHAAASRPPGAHFLVRMDDAQTDLGPRSPWPPVATSPEWMSATIVTPMVTPPIITPPSNLRRYILVRSPTRSRIARRQGLDPCVRSGQHDRRNSRCGTERFLQAHFRFPPMPKMRMH